MARCRSYILHDFSIFDSLCLILEIIFSGNLICISENLVQLSTIGIIFWKQVLWRVKQIGSFLLSSNWNWVYKISLYYWIIQARLQQYMNCERLDVQAGFRKGRETRDQIANICWIIEKAREFQKTSISALLTMPKPLTMWITINCGKFWKRWAYQTTWPASWETYIQVRKQQLELDMEQQTGSK